MILSSRQMEAAVYLAVRKHFAAADDVVDDVEKVKENGNGNQKKQSNNKRVAEMQV